MSLTATIVGIVPNLRQRDFQLPDPDPIAYLPFRTDPRGFMTLLVRSAGRSERDDADPARGSARHRCRTCRCSASERWTQQLAQARWPFRIFGTMFAIFALIALALSAVGLYAVTAYAVSQRTQEIGVRMALGAQGNEVAWLFLRRSFIQLAIGLTLGIAGAFGVGTLFSQTQLLVQNSAAIRSRSAASRCCWRSSRSWRACCRRGARRGSIRWSRCGATRADDGTADC